MAKKQYNIRWRESDTAELNRTIKNFNAKIYRLRKTRPELAEFLPDTVSKTNVVNGIGTRADYNRVINSLQRFSRRGAEEPLKSERGAKTTAWGVREAQIKQRAVNVKRKKRLEEIQEQDVKVGGKSTGIKRAEMGRIKENALFPSKKSFNKMSQKEWDLFTSSMERELSDKLSESKKYRMRDNYIKALEQCGYPDDVIDLVKSVDIDSFVETVINDETASFDWIVYDPKELDVRIEKARESWVKATEQTK